MLYINVVLRHWRVESVESTFWGLTCNTHLITQTFTTPSHCWSASLAPPLISSSCPSCVVWPSVSFDCMRFSGSRTLPSLTPCAHNTSSVEWWKHNQETSAGDTTSSSFKPRVSNQILPLVHYNVVYWNTTYSFVLSQSYYVNELLHSNWWKYVNLDFITSLFLCHEHKSL